MKDSSSARMFLLLRNPLPLKVLFNQQLDGKLDESQKARVELQTSFEP